LEDERVLALWQAERLGREGVVVELVEVTLVGEFLICPDSLQTLDELSTASGKMSFTCHTAE
jgi:hypothetical protein